MVRKARQFKIFDKVITATGLNETMAKEVDIMLKASYFPPFQKRDIIQAAKR